MKLYLEMSPKKFAFFFQFISEIGRFMTKHDIIFELTPDVMVIRSARSRPVEGEPESGFKSVIPLKFCSIEEHNIFSSRRDNKIWFGVSNADFKTMVDKLSLAAYFTTIGMRLSKPGNKVGLPELPDLAIGLQSRAVGRHLPDRGTPPSSQRAHPDKRSSEFTSF
jgi:hypothetical protein